MAHPAIERHWSKRSLEMFFKKYGHGHPDEKTVEMRQKLWRLQAIGGLAQFGPGYTCYTTFPIMMGEWDRCYMVIGDVPRAKVCRMAANSNSRFHRPQGTEGDVR